LGVTETPEDRFIAKVGDKVRALREAQGLEQAEVAKRMRLPLRNCHQLEEGWRNLTLRSVFRIAAALEVTPKDLLNVDQ
jgi:transcriptional regulator with XRE-family HTH domain